MSSPDCRALVTALRTLRRNGFAFVRLADNAGYAWQATPRTIATPYVLAAYPRDGYWVLSSGRLDVQVDTADDALAFLRGLSAIRVLPGAFAHLAVTT